MEVTSIADPKTILMALQEVRPTVFGAVPRVWERMKAMIELRMGQETDEQRKMAATWAFGVGKRKVLAEQAHLRGQGAPPDEALLAEYGRADALVLSRVRQLLGLNEARWLVSGAAPIAPDVLAFFGALGLPIHEVWGMSETSCVVTVNPRGRAKLGTVGLPVPGTQLSLAPDGELLVKGPLVMRGYRNDRARTDETIDADGWLHTGDIATIDGEGYVSIVDRKKELIINAAGKNMSPANIENTLKASSLLISQAACIGDRRPFNVALIVLDPEAVKAYPSSASIDAAVAEAVERANQRLSRVEQIKRYRVLSAAWEPGGDELTPTMKLKRKPIAEKYAAEIEKLYEGVATACD
jgi:long-subunit acyl-CoA synthetase (AMP-forming)